MLTGLTKTLCRLICPASISTTLLPTVDPPPTSSHVFASSNIQPSSISSAESLVT